MSDIEAVEFECGACGAINHLPFEKILDLKTAPLCGSCNESLFRNLNATYEDLSPKNLYSSLDESRSRRSKESRVFPPYSEV